MPARNRKKSKTEGLFKQCQHLSWDNCRCPWWGRIKRQRVSLSKWAGQPIPNKDAAKRVLARLTEAVLGGAFDKRGERGRGVQGGMTFSAFLDDYTKQHVEGDAIRSTSIPAYVEVFRANFGTQPLATVAADPFVFERWLKQEHQRKKWSPATFNRYVQFGRALFNWGRRRKLVTENPFEGFDLKAEANKRDQRLSADQEQKLFDACDRLDEPVKSRLVKVTSEIVGVIRQRAEEGELQKDLATAFGLSRPLVCQIINGRVWKPRSGTLGKEMRRRLIGALDLGLRQGEMLRLQVKHIDYETWTVHLPAAITKTAKDQEVYAETARVREMLKERRGLGPDGFIFGRENGHFVASFDKTWQRLFTLAGLPVGRAGGFVWHDLRHEYGSLLIEHGASIQEAKELMRHADIRTTARYLTARTERLRELAGKLGTRR